MRDREKKVALRANKVALLSKEGFRSKAPEQVVAGVEREVAELDLTIATLDAHIGMLAAGARE